MTLHQYKSALLTELFNMFRAAECKTSGLSVTLRFAEGETHEFSLCDQVSVEEEVPAVFNMGWSTGCLLTELREATPETFFNALVRTSTIPYVFCEKSGARSLIRFTTIGPDSAPYRYCSIWRLLSEECRLKLQKIDKELRASLA